LRTRAALDAAYAARVSAVTQYFAGVVQRHFRGWYSRKNVHDYYARKAYVQAITAKGETMRAELDAAYIAQLEAHLAAAEAKQKQDFEALSGGLHHLVSTKAQPGVYNPPWATTMDAVPSAFGVPLETHLRLGVLRQLRSNGLYPASRTTALSSTMAGTQRAHYTAMVDPVRGALVPDTAGAAARTGLGPAPAAALGHRNVTLVPAYVADTRRSLQSSAPYDVVLASARQEARNTKRANLDTKPFMAGGRAEIIGAPPPLGVNATLPFVEQHLMERTGREMEALTGRHLRMTEAPFVAQSSRSSRLFEDTERRRVAQASALLAHASAVMSGSGGAGAGAASMSATVTRGALSLSASASVAAGKAGTGSSAHAAGVSPTRTLRQGSVVAVVVGGEPDTAQAPGALSASVAGLPVGSGAAAVRRHRKAHPGTTSESAGSMLAPTVPGSTVTSLLASRGVPFMVTNDGALLGLDSRGTLITQPGPESAAAVKLPPRPRPLMRPPRPVGVAGDSKSS
jgi:hypothetical protein